MHEWRRYLSDLDPKLSGSLGGLALNRARIGVTDAAERAAFLRAVLLLGVPFCRPPRRSPGRDPRGIAIFRYFCYSATLPPLGCALRSFARAQSSASRLAPHGLKMPNSPCHKTVTIGAEAEL